MLVTLEVDLREWSRCHLTHLHFTVLTNLAHVVPDLQAPADRRHNEQYEEGREEHEQDGKQELLMLHERHLRAWGEF